ncbi:MAG: excinuclease ABC subunit UvrC [Alphaproteobacteria bacterium]|nr:excinuclease ABC subunit UvrC [Alphaproteobacteria bacterium]
MSNEDEIQVSEPPAPLDAGAAVIADYLTRLPNAPGVYRMIDRDGDVLYVGKAANLKKRVVAYTKPYDQPARIARMIANTASMEFVQTNSEVEALLLEANLIKRLRPRYNVHLRDDKSFPFILVTGDHVAPQIIKHRGAKSRKGEYFGPFASAYSVNGTLNTLQRAFLLRSCSDSVFEGRTRPCLLYQIKRCSAPCVGKISPEDYQHLVDQAVGFLRGKSQDVKGELTHEMEAAAEALDFEKAARMRDRVRALAHVQLQQGINPQTIEEADLFAAHQEGGHTCIQVFFFRSGQNWGNRAYFPRHDRAIEAAEVLDSFLAQFYDEREPPKLILISHDVPGRALLEEALSIKADRRVEVLMPQRGEKREVMAQAVMNARESLARRMAESATQARLLEGVAEAFDLDHPPERIEVYDNSHIQGTNAIGAFIVSGPEGFVKSQYRKFNIKSTDLKPGDDYAMMREVLMRRFTRLVKENTPKPVAPVFDEKGGDDDVDKARHGYPDLVLIDGGLGQLSVAREVLAQVGVTDVPVVSIAKGPDRDAGREHFFMDGRPPFQMELKSPVLFYLQRLRDEAHRFAIGTHRAKRAKAFTASPLDEIEGIGPNRKRALLNHFGSGRAVTRAGLADLEAVGGISKAMAKKIYDHFHDKG